ncbi:MAG: DUF1801 domain-containing protein [Myxococcota bacterium]
MADLKTKATKASAAAFLNAIEDDAKRKDAKRVAKMMRAATGERARMWGTSIVGYGKYAYTYASGRSGEWPLVGFSPRKANLVLYIVPGFSKYAALMKKLGKFKTGKSCLYVKKLDDVDLAVLERLITASVAFMRKKYPDA